MATFTLALSPERGFQRTREQSACRAEALAPTFRKERWGPVLPCLPLTAMLLGRSVCPVLPGPQRKVCLPNVCTRSAATVHQGPLRCCGRRVTVLPWPSLALGFPCCPESWEDPAGSTRKDSVLHLCKLCTTAAMAQTHGRVCVAFEVLWGLTDKYVWNDCEDGPSWRGRTAEGFLVSALPACILPERGLGGGGSCLLHGVALSGFEQSPDGPSEAGCTVNVY